MDKGNGQGKFQALYLQFVPRFGAQNGQTWGVLPEMAG